MTFRLLVEGPDDKHLINNIAREHRVELANADVHPSGGREELLRTLPVTLKGSYDAIGIVLDADGNAGDAWRAVSARLRENDYSVPTQLARDGVLIAGRRPAVGVWLMPDNSTTGMLEDFAAQLIPAEDPLWPRATAVVASIPSTERRFAPQSTRKAEIHTWLAWQEVPGTPLGLAVTRHYFDTDSELCKRFVQWLRRLIRFSARSL